MAMGLVWTLMVTAALVFFGIAWCLVYHPEAVIHY